MNPLELIQKLSEYIGADKAKGDEVVGLLRQHAHGSLFQPISNIGFAAGKAEGEKAVGTHTARVTELEGQLQAATAKVDELEKSKPDVAKIRGEYDGKITELTQKLRTAEQTHKVEMEKALRSRDVADFKVKLTTQAAKRGDELDPDYVEVQAMLLDQRLKYEGGKPSVMQSKDSNIPVSIEPNQNVFDVVAGQVLEKAPAVAFLSRTSPGGGTRGSEQNGSRGGSIYDGIREGEKKRSEAQGTGADAVFAGLGRR